MNDSQQPRPLFAEDFPADARIDALVEAFVRGDYARVRKVGGPLARDAEDEAVRSAAQTLIDRTAPDRLTRGLLVLAGLLVLTLSAWWVVHGKAPPSTPSRIEHVR